jgi:hypothetical protein
MATTTRLAAGVLSLLLLGPWGKALAASAAGSPGGEKDVITLFGTSFCLAQASPDAHCDWRLPARARPAPAAEARVVNLLGMSVCFGQAPPSTACDVTLPAPKPSYPARHARR